MKTRTYYTLVAIDGTPTDSPWGVAFGAYDKADVEAELEDYRDHGWKKSQLKIIKTNDTATAINAAVAALNEAL